MTMQDVSSVANRAAGAPAQMEYARSDSAERPRASSVQESPGDRVELSEAAANYDPEAEAARELDERINVIKIQIAADAYITPDKIDAAVERLYAALTSH